MINMLIGQPLLPASDYPETGVPCVISAGATDSIQVVAGAQKRAVPFGTASVAASVTLRRHRRRLPGRGQGEHPAGR